MSASKVEVVSGALPVGVTARLDNLTTQTGKVKLDGTPTQSGTFNFTLRVTDIRGNYMEKPYVLTVKPNIFDNPMDQCCYDPVRDVIFGVRGGYLFEFTNAGVFTRSQRFRPVSFSDSSIAYDPVSDRIYISCWNDPGGMFLDNGGNFVDNPYRVIYKINPATLAVDSTFDPLSVFGIIVNNTIYAGPHQIVCKSGIIYGVLHALTGGTSVEISLFSWNPTSNVSLRTNAGLHTDWADFVLNVAGTKLYLADSYDQILASYDAATLAADGDSIQYPFSVQPIGVAQNPGTGRLYITTRSQQILRVDTPLAPGSNPPSLANLVLPDATANPWRIRYNPNDGKIYVPGYASNVVYRIDPATDAITVEDALDGHLDSPFDMVFTPTKKFAVCHGLTGLKEIA